jgi:hypothetical protein
MYALIALTGVIFLFLFLKNFKAMIKFIRGPNVNCLVLEFSAGNQAEFLEVPGTQALTYSQARTIKDVNIAVQPICCGQKLQFDWECSEMCMLPRELILGMFQWPIRKLLLMACHVHLYYRVDRNYLVLFCEKNELVGPRNFINALQVDRSTSTPNLALTSVTSMTPLYPPLPQ